MKRSAVPLVAASFALAATVHHVSAAAQHDDRMPGDHGDHGGDVPPPYARMATDEMRVAVDRCALRSPFDEATLRAVQVVATLTPPRGVTLSFVSAPPGAQGRALTRCIAAALTSSLRRAAAQVSQMLNSVTEVYPELDLPMDPPPPDPTGTLDAAAVAQLRARLSAAASDMERLIIVHEVEAAQQGVVVADAVSLLSTFTEPAFRGAAAGQLCRVAHGPRALASLSRPLAATERTWLRQATRGRCGVSAPRPPPPEPPVPVVSGDPYACTTSADCALVCNAPPDCCGSPCGCSRAMRAEHAAAEEAQCRSARRGERCEAMGCAYRQFTAVCRAGRCAAVEGHGVGL